MEWWRFRELNSAVARRQILVQTYNLRGVDNFFEVGGGGGGGGASCLELLVTPLGGSGGMPH